MTRSAYDVFDGFETRPIAYTPPDSSFIACNPSVYFDGKRWLCVLRCINYRLGHDVPELVYSKNVMVELNPKDWSVLAAHPIEDRSNRELSEFPIHGYEDCRLFHWQGRLWLSATSCDLIRQSDEHPYGNREICLLELDSEFHIAACYPMRGGWSMEFQKNWIPCPTHGVLKFVYSVDRALTISVGTDLQLSPISTEDGFMRHGRDVSWRAVGNHRGSSQGCRLDTGEWLYLVHADGYMSQFVLADESFRPKRVSESFYFGNSDQVEFSAGMAVDKDRSRIVVSYSRRDASAELAFFPFTTVMMSLNRIHKGWAWQP